ncbi:hypothetical protein J4227_00740 [Candidatus Woesearchaeota archaeon]|nr:hypothetical protein [Candidatus Woesearchaeota archaeon]
MAFSNCANWPKLTFFFFSLSFFLLAIGMQPTSALYETRLQCPGSVCIENGEVDISLLLYHTNLSVWYTKVDYVDIIYNTTIASAKDLNLIVTPISNASLSLQGKLPPAPSGFALQIVPCFTFYLLDAEEKAIGNETWTCGKYPYSLQIFKESLVECFNTSGCRENEICTKGKCEMLSCGLCEYVDNHGCLPYGCCDSRECELDSICADHECQKLECASSQRIFNRTCIDLNCQYDEVAMNHECMPLECAEDENPTEHACVKITCGPNEYAENGQCYQVQCAPNQEMTSDGCALLECGPLAKMTDTGCRTDYATIFRWFAGFAVILGLAAFLYYKYTHQAVQAPPPGRF